LLGNAFRLTQHRGEILRLPQKGTPANLAVDPIVVATAHPSSVLRGPAEDRDAAFAALVTDLKFAVGRLSSE
jgi:DNA polymerase